MPDLTERILLQAEDYATALVKEFGAVLNGVGTSLVEVSDVAEITGGYLSTLGELAFTTGVGFDGLAASSETTAAALTGVDASLAETTAAAAEAAPALDSVAASEDAVAVSSGTAAQNLHMVQLATAAVAVGAGIAAAESVKMAGDFQSEITSLSTGAGELESNLGMVSDGVLQMANDTGESTKQLTDALYLIDSAGQHGQQSLRTLHDVAEGAKVGIANMGDVADGTTTIMTDYAAENISSAQAVNTLIATVAAGKTHMGDLSESLAHVLPTASAAGIGLTDVSAAMATMTGEGTPAADAATYLRQTIMSLENPSTAGANALASIGLTASDVSESMKKSLPATLEMITDRLKKQFPEGSAAYVSALADIAGGSKQMQGMLQLTGTHLDTFKTNVTNITDAVHKGGDSITGWSQVQADFNTQMDRAREAVETLGIRIGTALMPAVAQLVNTAFVPLVDYIAHFNEHANVLIPILAGIAAFIVSVLVPAAWSLAAPILAAAAPFLLFGAAVAGLVAIFMHFYNSNAGFHAFIDKMRDGIIQLWNTISANFIPVMQQIGNIIQTQVWPVLVNIGSFLMTTFKPVWDQLVATFQTQLIPAWNDLMKALQPALPLLQFIGMIIGGLLIGSIILLIAVLGGLVGAIAGVLPGLIQAFGGIVQIISGVLQVVGGIIGFFVDLFTGHFDRLGADLAHIWNGIATIFIGAWNVIAGILRGAFGLIFGFIAGFFSTLNAMTGGALGHIAGAIGGWFAWLFGAIGGFFAGLWSHIIGGVQAAWGFIVKVVQDGIARFVDQITAPFRFIASLFVWLYQHNTYFQRLMDAIVGFVRSGVALLVTAWQAVIAWIVGAWQGLVVFAIAVWNNIVAEIQAAVNFVVAILMAVWTFAIGWLTDRWNELSGKAVQAWAAVSAVFSGIWNNYIAGPLGNLWNSISGWFSKLAQGALDSGRKFIDMLVSGITSGAGAIWNAVTGIANTIWKALGFHSPAEAGPASDADQWMPNLIKMLSTDLEAGAPQMQEAAMVVAQPLAATIGGSSTGIAPSTSVRNAGGIYITINIDGRSAKTDRELVDMLMDKLSRQLNRSGNIHPWVTGGRA